MKTITLHRTGTYATAEANVEYAFKCDKRRYEPHYFIDMNGETFTAFPYNDDDINICLVGLVDDELTRGQKDSLKLLYNIIKDGQNDVSIKFHERCMHNYLSDNKQQELISYITN